MSGSKLPREAHFSRPWRIHEVAPDFRLEDVWELPGRGGPGEFPRLVEVIASMDPAQSSTPLVRALFAVRWKVGGLLGWDEDGSGIGSRVPTLRERLPEDLRKGATGPKPVAADFAPLYMTEDEWAAEAANSTMHGILHLGRVEEPNGAFRAQMAILVKPNGVLGRGYMAAIRPFRHLVVYPALLREGGRRWDAIASGRDHSLPRMSPTQRTPEH